MRLFLAALWVCVFVQSFAFAQPVGFADKKTVAFDAYLDNRLVGSHIFTIEGTDKTILVHSNLQLKAKFLGLWPINYTHQSTERWKDGCLIALESQTQKRGKPMQVKAQTNSLGLNVIGDDNTRTMSGCIKSFAYWDNSLLQDSQLLNTENGELIEVSVETINHQDSGGKSMVIGSSEAEIQLEYSADGEWLSLTSQLKVGGTLHYIRKN